MGITRSNIYKRNKSGGKTKTMRKKRKFELGRPAAMTKIGERRVRDVRVRGGHLKQRALRLDSGHFSWGSENITRKTKILNVVYNASNNELVRTNTLVKSAIVQVDATPFKQYFFKHYGVSLGKSKPGTKAAPKSEEQKKRNAKIEEKISEAIGVGRVLACISSRPGQTGTADGYLLEGEELDFYTRKLAKKK